MNDVGTKVLITGANGLVGQHLGELSWFNAVPFLTSRTPVANTRHEQSMFDWTNLTQISRFLDTINPDVIIHTAGVTSVDYAEKHPEETLAVNVEAVKEMVRWCKENGCRLVHFSTDFVFDGQHGMYSEQDAPNPLSHYGRTKLESETIVLDQLDDAVVIRTVLAYGYQPHLSRLNFPLWIKRELEQGHELKITADQYRTPTYAVDLAQVTQQLAFTGHSGLFHISGSEYMNVYEFAQQVAQVFELDETLLSRVQTQTMGQTGQRPMKTGFDISRARSVLNFDPASVNDGLRQMKARMPG